MTHIRNDPGDTAAPSRRTVVTRVAVLARDLAPIVLIDAAGLALGFVLFVALFYFGALHGMAVLFFRGLILAAVAFAATFAALAWLAVNRPLLRVRPRDAFSAAVLSLSFNVCFLVVVPVTVDRSISVFVLGEMAAHPETLYAPADMERLFTGVYVGEDRQIARRLQEQTITGNLDQVGPRYRISERGRRFIALSQFVAWLFDGDKRFSDPTGQATRGAAAP